MSEVPTTATPVSESDAVKALLNTGLPRLGLMTREGAQLILAQLWLESGRGASLFNHNWGNITAGLSWTGDFWRPPWFNKSRVEAMEDGEKKTRLLRLHQLMVEGKAPQKFRAYPTSRAGFEDYLARLSKEFKAIVEAAKTGDPMTFARAVKESGYTPDLGLEEGAKTFRLLSNEFAKRGLFNVLPKAPPASALPSSSSGPQDSSSGGPSESNPVALPVLREGAKGPAVELFCNLAGTREFTNDIVMKWQTLNGLKADGVIGPKSWNLIISSTQMT